MKVKLQNKIPPALWATGGLEVVSIKLPLSLLSPRGSEPVPLEVARAHIVFSRVYKTPNGNLKTQSGNQSARPLWPESSKFLTFPLSPSLPSEESFTLSKSLSRAPKLLDFFPFPAPDPSKKHKKPLVLQQKRLTHAQHTVVFCGPLANKPYKTLSEEPFRPNQENMDFTFFLMFFFSCSPGRCRESLLPMKY